MGQLFPTTLLLLFGLFCLFLLHERMSFHPPQPSSLAVSHSSSQLGSSCSSGSDWSNPSVDSFQWDLIEPTDDLNWVDCFIGFTCTRLKVPLNYSSPETGIAVIALVRQSSSIDPDSAEHKGPILFNPGGPGGSGVDLLLERAKVFRVLVGPAFDLVGFDPRGVAASVPRASFFETEAQRRIWNSDPANLLVVASTQDELPTAWARSSVVGDLAGKNGNEYLPHINTENTARDMLYITEKYGREKVQYIGYSYGTVLGTTFASLFPEKIERMVLDGVVDSDNYYATLWDNNLLDTDKTMQAFYDLCYAAGPSNCAFWFDSSSRIQVELEKLYESVRERPVPVISTRGYGILGYPRLRATIFSTLYAPTGYWPYLAQGLAELRAMNNGTRIFDILQAREGPFDCACSNPNKYATQPVDDALHAIACNDGAPVDPSLDAFLEYSMALRNKTDWGDAWEFIHLGCSNYPKWPKKHFQGPVGASSTSSPILFIGNTADPVTPLWAAHKISRRFNGSVVLTQDSPGHCSPSTVSLCTTKAIQQYIASGTLPAKGTVCSMDTNPFLMDKSDGTFADLPQRVLANKEDEVLFQIMRDNAKTTVYSGPLQL